MLLFVTPVNGLAEDVKPPDLIEEALASIGAGKKDLGIRKDLNTCDRMNRFDRWIVTPLTAPVEIREDARRLFRAAPNPALWLKEVGILGEMNDISSLPGEPILEPEGLRSCLAPLLAAMTAANEKLGANLEKMNKRLPARLMAWLFDFSVTGLEDSPSDDLPVGQEVLEMVSAADQMDRKAVFEAGLTVLEAMLEVKKRLTDYQKEGHDITTQTLITPLGLVEIGGPGPDVHDSNAAVVIDVGGDDIYRGETAVGRNGLCSVVLDLKGDDTYLGLNNTQGAGIGGIGILWDAAGDDFYRAGNFAQGAGVFGMGLLVDEGGNDHYSGGAFVQAAAAWGFGALLDLEGEDLYDCRNSGQAFSGVKGTAVLCDSFGNDKYLAGVATPDHRDSSMNQSFAQGFAIGMRDLSGGGFALLADQWGNDHYECQYFGQGAGYFMGLGILYDKDGKDTYAARRYAQGAGIHYAFGMLMDERGDDRYLSWGVSQGCGHDYGIGFLLEGVGNDFYAADWLSMGASNANGTGILIDNAGEDRYGALSEMPVGKLSKGRRSGGIGLFVDAGGKDAYSRNGADNTLWGENRFSAGIDRNEGRNSGIPMLQSDEIPPENPEVERRRKAEAERLARLLPDATEISSSKDMLRLLSVASSRGLEKKIPEQAGKRLLAMDPNRSLPLIMGSLDLMTVSDLAFLKDVFIQHAFYAIPALSSETKEKGERFEARRCYFLGLLKDTRTLNVFLDSLSNPSWRVRSSAVRAVGELLDRGRLEDLIPMKRALEAALKENSSKPLALYLKEEKKRCTMLLSVLVRSVAVPVALYDKFSNECKENGNEGECQCLAIFAYENAAAILKVMDAWIADIQQSEEAAKKLMPLLNDSDGEVRRAAAYSLGQMRYAPSIPCLLDLLHDSELWVRDGAVLSLALFKNDVAEALCKRMEEEGTAFRILGLDILSRIKTEQAEKCTQAWIDDPDENVRRAAEKALDLKRKIE